MKRKGISRSQAGYLMLGAALNSLKQIQITRERRRIEIIREQMTQEAHGLRMTALRNQIKLQEIKIRQLENPNLPEGVKQCPTCMQYYSASMSGCPECSQGANTQDDRPDYARLVARGSTTGK